MQPVAVAVGLPVFRCCCCCYSWLMLRYSQLLRLNTPHLSAYFFADGLLQQICHASLSHVSLVRHDTCRHSRNSGFFQPSWSNCHGESLSVFNSATVVLPYPLQRVVELVRLFGWLLFVHGVASWHCTSLATFRANPQPTVPPHRWLRTHDIFFWGG